MAEWSERMQNSLRAGVVAGVATTLTAATCGDIEGGNAVMPLNAISHIAWGEEATTRGEASWKYTATGVALNMAAVTSWATLHELFFGRSADEGDVAGTFLGSVFISTLAYVTDYHVVPAWLTPGFEKRLSGRSLLGIYTALALGLTLGSLWRPDGKRSES